MLAHRSENKIEHKSKWRKLDMPEGDDRAGRDKEAIDLCRICGQTVDVQFGKDLGECFTCSVECTYLCSECTHTMKKKYGTCGQGKNNVLPYDNR